MLDVEVLLQQKRSNRLCTCMTFLATTTPQSLSCKGTASSSMAAAHTSRCCGVSQAQLSASRARQRKRSMKAASRSSEPCVEEWGSIFLKGPCQFAPDPSLETNEQKDVQTVIYLAILSPGL